MKMLDTPPLIPMERFHFNFGHSITITIYNFSIPITPGAPEQDQYAWYATLNDRLPFSHTGH